MDVSVIIPCYQSAETLAAQLDAVCAQDWDGEWEVICVYQPSTDETAAVLARYAEREPRLRVVEAGERYHVSYARNAGVAAALGSRLLFCDADDVMQPGWVAAMAAGLDELEVVAGQVDTGALNSPAVAASRGELPALRQWPGFLRHAGGGNLGVRRELFDRLGGFSEGLPALEDTDFTFRAQLDGGATLGVVTDAVLEYRYRARFSEIVAQARSYARGEMWLRSRYEQRGMPRLTLRYLVRGAVGLVLYAPQLLTADGRLKYAWRYGYRMGLQGAILRQRYRPRLGR